MIYDSKLLLAITAIYVNYLRYLVALFSSSELLNKNFSLNKTVLSNCQRRFIFKECNDIIYYNVAAISFHYENIDY